MTILPKQFRKGGFVYDQIIRSGNLAIYQQHKPGQSGKWFEVGIIKANPRYEAYGKVIEASESWPPSTQWGVFAWTYSDLAGAKRRMVTLLPPEHQNAS